MEYLTIEEKRFLEDLLKYSKRKQNGYWVFQPQNKRYGKKKYKEHRILMQLHLNKRLSIWEIVHHKDRNKLNNSLDNLEVLNSFEHASMPPKEMGGKPKNWKPANTINQKVLERAKEIMEEMEKINYSEISRRLAKEGIIVTSFTLSKYLKARGERMISNGIQN